MNPIAPFSRRQFLADASRLTALSALAGAYPFAASSAIPDDPRVSQTPIADAGYASVHKVGEGLYATISDPSKGFSTICNGGFLIGKETALLLEGFGTPTGARFQMEAFHKVTDVAAAGALLTHYHFDHSFGSAFYGAHGIQLWAHANVSKRIFDSYVSMQAADRAAFLAPLEKRATEAKSDLARQHARGYAATIGNIFDMAKKTSLALPNRPLDPDKLPLQVDLGHFPIVIEHYPGHSGTDLIVRVPEQKVVYTGDLLFSNAYPACFDDQCTMSGWRNTLKTFASWDKDTLFIPGHGAVCGQQGVQNLRDVFDDFAEQAEKMHKAGVPVTDAVDQYIIPDKFKNFPVFDWGICISSAIAKLYADMGAK
ncbi:MAG TPA: MBL fold metallo-hydrolase [Terriglobales bacterium]|nr:MBL fold metallo-hydrolase [Terriglobales bacterium]